jgi:peptidoglycan/LPS O-acetylase OafA/YrhL
MLDGMRAVAALLILLYHAWLLSGEPVLDGGPIRNAISSGHLAVSLFFVISGFVLFLPVARRHGRFGSLRRYAVRRVARIVPAYYAALALCLLAFPLLTTDVLLEQRLSAGSLLAHLTFVQNEARLLPGYDGALGFGVDPVVWTLSIEVAFYVLLPFVASWFWRHPWSLLAAALGIGVAARLLIDPLVDGRTASLLLSAFPLHLADFAAGMAAAIVAVRLPIDPRRAAGLGLAGAAVAIVILVLLGGPDASAARDVARRDPVAMAILPLAFAAALLGLLAGPRLLRSPLELGAVRWLGTVSYGTFLVHFPVLLLALHTLDFDRDGSGRAFLALLAFGLPASLGLAWVFWVAIERPVRILAQRAVGRAGGPISAPAQHRT